MTLPEHTMTGVSRLSWKNLSIISEALQTCSDSCTDSCAKTDGKLRPNCVATCHDAEQRARLQVGANQAPSNVNNLTAVLFLWTILPGYAAASYMPTIVLERPLFVRCAQTCIMQRALPLSAVPTPERAAGSRQSTRDG